ncbi:MAG: ComEC/Rec2 family competence protein [Patescibacteria group bacterium]
MSTSWRYILGLLALIAITIWLAVAVYPEPKLRLIACDVGQGDAILAIYGKTQILVDGGPDNSVLDCLSENLPFWDREIELMVITHPQVDHYTGLIEVLRRYDVSYLLATQIDSSAQRYQVLKDTVGGSGVKVVHPTTGMVIRMGLIYLDIVHPTEEYIASFAEGSGTKVLGTFTTSRDLNDFSIVANLRLGDFDALLTGDIGPDVMSEVIAQLALSDSRTIEYIKIPHHGSKNGLTSNLLSITSPEIAVISVGKDNRYGHPHDEVIKLLSDKGIKTLRTDIDGDIEVVTDGKTWWLTN